MDRNCEQNPTDPRKTQSAASPAIDLRRISTHRGIRVLAWDQDVLYACRGYQILSMRVSNDPSAWEPVAAFRPPWWRNLTSRTALASRLVRDGFHALTVLGDGVLVGAVPGAIVTRSLGSDEFRVTHQIVRGTRPLHITATSSSSRRIYWGEYFDNRERAEVHIYASEDRGQTWHVAYTFPAGAVRHIHNIVYDRWADCFWILTGDGGAECKVLRASCDLRSVDVVLAGNQQARAVAAIPTKDALYLSTDTPLEQNHVYRLDRSGRLECAGDLNNSSMYGCRVGEALFFSTMVEPSTVNTDREVHLAGSRDGSNWQTLLRWKKDRFSMRYFQYGNAFLPAGENTTRVLAVSTIAVESDDLTTTRWEVGHEAASR